jgi:hypothetical protein
MPVRSVRGGRAVTAFRSHALYLEFVVRQLTVPSLFAPSKGLKQPGPKRNWNLAHIFAGDTPVPPRPHRQKERRKMPVFNGTVRYNPPAPNQTSSFLVENGGATSLLIKQGLSPAATANHLFFGLHKGNNAPLQVSGVRQPGPNGGAAIVFTTAG